MVFRHKWMSVNWIGIVCWGLYGIVTDYQKKGIGELELCVEEYVG